MFLITFALIEYFYPGGGRGGMNDVNTPKLINLEGNSCLMRNALDKLPSSIRETLTLKRFRNPRPF